MIVAEGIGFYRVGMGVNAGQRMSDTSFATALKRKSIEVGTGQRGLTGEKSFD